MRLRSAALAALLVSTVALGDDPMPKSPTVDQAVAKSADARKKVAAAVAEQAAADKVLKDVLAALNLQLKDLGIDPVTPPGPKPVDPVVPPGPGPKPTDPDVAKLQYALFTDKADPVTKPEKLAKLAAVYRMAVKTADDKDLPTAADVLNVVKEAVATQVDDGDSHFLVDLRRAIADVFLNPRLKTVQRNTPLTDDERKKIAATYEAVAAALAQLKP